MKDLLAWLGIETLSLIDFKELELFNLMGMLTDIEEAFRSILIRKSNRPEMAHKKYLTPWFCPISQGKRSRA